MRVRGSTSGAGYRLEGEWGQEFTDRAALDRMFSAAYEELRRLAAAVRRSDPSATLNPTALVNEAWLKLARSPELGGVSPLHFKRIAARAMRQLLVEAARRRTAWKRGRGFGLVSFDEAVPEIASASSGCGEEELLRLDGALEDLARLHPRQASIVESRFFGGLDVSETAEVMGVSEATVARDWRAARAWLGRELRRA